MTVSPVTSTQKLLWQNPCVLIHMYPGSQPLTRADAETSGGVGALKTASIFKDTLLQATCECGCAGYWLQETSMRISFCLSSSLGYLGLI